MSVTLVLPDPITTDLIRQTALPDESAGVLLARRHQSSNGDTRLLGREVHWAPSEAYRDRSPSEMSITPEGYVRALGLAEQDGAVAIWLHTHPQGSPLPSNRDHLVDSSIADVFRLRSGSDLYGTIIAAPNGPTIDLTGTLQKEGMKAEPIDRYWMVGERWWLQRAFHEQSHPTTLSMFDRSVRAFGAAVQATIGMLQIAIVGVGGTGSAIAEQLARLGARHVLLVDAKTLSKSNVTRVYGSTLAQAGTP